MLKFQGIGMESTRPRRSRRVASTKISFEKTSFDAFSKEKPPHFIRNSPLLLNHWRTPSLLPNFFSFPKEEWISLRTTNIIEQLNKEFTPYKSRLKKFEIAGTQYPGPIEGVWYPPEAKFNLKELCDKKKPF